MVELDDKRQLQCAHAGGAILLPLAHQHRQDVGVAGALSGDHADLGEMPANCF